MESILQVETWIHSVNICFEVLHFLPSMHTGKQSQDTRAFKFVNCWSCLEKLYFLFKKCLSSLFEDV